MAMKEIPYKGQLFRYCAKNKKNPPEFLSSSNGPPHDPRFTSKVFIDGSLVGEGEGKSIKKAEHKASKAALEALGYQETGIDFGGLLNELCQKKRWSFKFVESDHSGPEFTCYAEVNKKIYPESTRRNSKKLAKKEAVYLALRELRREFPSDISELPDILPDESGSENCSLSGSTGDTSLDRSTGENALVPSAAISLIAAAQHNYISILNQICQKKGWLCNFLEKTVGENPHMFQFTCKASINDINYPESNPKKTKQLAKKEAAFLALKELKNECPTEVLFQALPDIHIDESVNENSSTSSPANVDQNKSGLASSASNSSFKVSFRDSGSTQSGAQRQTNGVKCSSFADFEVSSSSYSRSSSNPLDPLREFDDITELDSGTFGKVIKAKKKLDDMYYAVKIVHIKNKDRNRFGEEVRVLARFDHPNVVRYFNAWIGEEPVGISYNSESSTSASSSSAWDLSRKNEKCLFIQMELCENGTLKKWIKKRKNIEKHKSLCFFKQIIEAVKYIHSQKLIHRDLKPANIFFTKDMVVKIGDFGLVAHMTGEDESEARQRTQCTGTPSYMAPEQKDGNKYENEVDIYALGLILVELLWIFGTDHERANDWKKICDGSLPPSFVEQYPSEESEIKKMLSKDPKKRPSANELKKFFEANEINESRTQ